MTSEPKSFSLAEALQALDALRSAAGLQPERFTLPAFVGMISDEVEALRSLGKSDSEIADIVRRHSPIDITAQELAMHYATPAERHPHGR